MKMKTLSVLAGAGVPLILAPMASAGLTGVKVTNKDPGDFGLFFFVTNIYATFDTREGDLIFAVAGTPNSPLSIRVQNGKFYQNPFGNDQAPNPDLFIPFPSLEFDTFVTIGKKTSNGDATLLTPGWPGFDNSELGGANNGEDMGWFVTPDDPQGSPNANNQVLLGQFTLDLKSGATGIEGEFLLAGRSNGVVFQEYFSFKREVPSPGALALFGAAGLIGRRRRRQE